jgi:hypothetical protein
MREEFLRAWSVRAPTCLPLREHLNGTVFPGRWARIHSLPGSKRYATTESEWDELLMRQNEVFGYLLDEGTPLQCVINRLPGDRDLINQFKLVPLGALQDGPDEPMYNSYLLPTIWTQHGLDALLRSIADEGMRGFFVAPDCLIGPYDGGVDVILADSAAVALFRRTYARWLSVRDDGR